MTTPLLAIVAHARSGALEHAWRLFREAGLEQVEDDPAVLSVRGRLLKDRALAAPAGAERRRFYLEAADAYGRAAVIGGATYPLINAATLWRLGGHADQSRALAGQVLELAERGEDEPETPYYRAATRAEALLLLGRVAEARDAFAHAIALQPRAWEDHASTLRQFALILDALGEDKAWLDPHRPPRALHFAGHMSLAPGDGAIAGRVRALIAEEGVGFGYGALAAGADIVIAEALLEAGAELHLVLPAPQAAFREGSVAGFGVDWTARFDAVIARAETVRSVGCPAEGPCPLNIRLAGEVAMGEAVMQAEVLTAEAVQLLILDGDEPTDGASGWIRAMWAGTGRRQHIVAAPRTRRRPAARAAAVPGPAPASLAAMLVVDVGGLDGAGAAHAEQLAAERLPALAAAVAGGPAPKVPPRLADETVLLAYETCADAAAAALSITAALGEAGGARVAGHYGIVRTLADPFSGAPVAVGWSARLPARILASAPPGAIHLSGDFAAALHGETPPGGARTEYVGDMPTDEVEEPIRLFSLKP